MSKRFDSWNDVGVFPKSATKKYRCPKCVERDRKNIKNLNLYIPDSNGNYFRCYAPNCEYCDHCYISPNKDYLKPQPIIVNTNLWLDFWATERAKRGFKIEDMEKRGIYPSYYYFGTENHLALAYPFYDLDGTLIAYAYRPQDKSIGFRFSKGAEMIFYNLQCLSEYKEDEMIPDVVITEGFDDCESFIKAGVKRVISVPNGVAISTSGKVQAKMDYLLRNMNIFDRIETVYLATDDDLAGNVLMEELARRIGKKKCKMIRLPKLRTKKPKDSNDILQAAQMAGKLQMGLDMLANFRANKKDGEDKNTCYSLWYPIEGVGDKDSMNAKLDDLYHNGSIGGVKLDLPLDEFVTWKKGRFALISGKYGSAKTDLAVNLSLRLACQHGWKFAVFMPETGGLEEVKALYMQVMCGTTIDKTAARIYNMQLPNEAVYEYCKNYIDENFIFIDKSMFKEGLTFDGFLDLAEELVTTEGIDCIIGDPFNAFFGAYEGADNKTGADVLNKQLTRVQSFKEETNCSVWLVPHPAGGSYKTAKDITEIFQLNFGAIWGNKVDIALLASRLEGTAKFGYGDDVSVLVRKFKGRYEGKLGETILGYDFKTGRFGYPPAAMSSHKFETFVPLPLMYQTATIAEIETLPHKNSYFDGEGYVPSVLTESNDTMSGNTEDVPF